NATKSAPVDVRTDWQLITAWAGALKDNYGEPLAINLLCRVLDSGGFDSINRNSMAQAADALLQINDENLISKIKGHISRCIEHLPRKDDGDESSEPLTELREKLKDAILKLDAPRREPFEHVVEIEFGKRNWQKVIDAAQTAIEYGSTKFDLRDS